MRNFFSSYPQDIKLPIKECYKPTPKKNYYSYPYKDFAVIYNYIISPNKNRKIFSMLNGNLIKRPSYFQLLGLSFFRKNLINIFLPYLILITKPMRKQVSQILIHNKITIFFSIYSTPFNKVDAFTFNARAILKRSFTLGSHTPNST